MGGYGRKAARYAQQQGRGFWTRNDKIGSLSGKQMRIRRPQRKEEHVLVDFKAPTDDFRTRVEESGPCH